MTIISCSDTLLLGLGCIKTLLVTVEVQLASALDVIQVIVEGAILGQRVLQVLHFLSSDAVADEDVIADLQFRVEADLYPTAFVSNLADDLDFQSIYFKNVTQNEDLGQVSWGGDQPTSVSEPLPLGICGLVVAPTARPKTRGRKFVPGVVEGLCDSSLWSSTFVTALNTFGAAYISPFLGDTSGAPWSPGVPNVANGWSPFLEALVTNVPAYQRRRKQGVGE